VTKKPKPPYFSCTPCILEAIKVQQSYGAGLRSPLGTFLMSRKIFVTLTVFELLMKNWFVATNFQLVV